MKLFSLVLVATFVGLVGHLAGITAPVRKPRDETGPPNHFTNSIGMKFVWIPPRSSMMGSPKEEKERQPDEIQHKVTLTRGFYMGVSNSRPAEKWLKIA